jgi:hypothetical protein
MKIAITLLNFLSAIIFCSGQDSISKDLSKGDRVILEKAGYQDTLYIGVSILEEVRGKYGTGSLKSAISKFRGNTSRSLFSKRQILKYDDKGLVFIFESATIKDKRLIIDDTCRLDEILIINNSEYCLGQICLNSLKSEIDSMFGKGSYGIMDGVTDSINQVYYSNHGLFLYFDKIDNKIILTKIHREMRDEHLIYRRKIYN